MDVCDSKKVIFPCFRIKAFKGKMGKEKSSIFIFWSNRRHADLIPGQIFSPLLNFIISLHVSRLIRLKPKRGVRRGASASKNFTERSVQNIKELWAEKNIFVQRTRI